MPAAHRRFAALHHAARLARVGRARSAPAAAILLGDLCLSWADELLVDLAGSRPPTLRRGQAGLRRDAHRADGRAVPRPARAGADGRRLGPTRAMPAGASATRARSTPSSARCTSAPRWPAGAPDAVGAYSRLRPAARRGVPAARRRPRRVRRPGRDRQAGRRRPARGQAHRAGRHALERPRRRRRRRVLRAHLGDPGLDARGVDALREVISTTGALAQVEDADRRPDRPGAGPRWHGRSRRSRPSRRAIGAGRARARGHRRARSDAAPVRTVTGPTDHVVVVGAGLAGLSAALRLAGAGRQVTVLEREPRARRPRRAARADGGLPVRHRPDRADHARPHRRRASPPSARSSTTGSTCMPVDPAVPRRSSPTARMLDVHSDVDAMAAEIARVCGRAGGRRATAATSTSSRSSTATRCSDFIDRNIDSPLDLLTPRPRPARGDRRLPQAGAEGRPVPHGPAHASGSSRSSRCTPGCRRTTRSRIYAVIAYMDSVAGVFFPRGGMHARARGAGRRGGKHGVDVPLRHARSTRVETVRATRRRRCITADGERIAADAVVLNPDLPVAYRDLLGREPWSVRRLRYSPSCFLLLAGSTAHVLPDARTTTSTSAAPGDGVFDELIDEGRLMTRPVAAGHQPDPLRPVARARRAAGLLRAVPDAEPRRATSTGARGARATATRCVRTLEQRGYVGFGDGDRGRARSRRRWTGQARGMERGHAVRGRAHVRPDRAVPAAATCWGDNVVFAGSGTAPGVGVPMVLVCGRLAAERVTGTDPAYRSRAWR